MISKTYYNTLRGLGLAMVLTTSLASYAETGSSQSIATPGNNLRIVSAAVREDAGGSVVETRISRGLANGVIAAQRLRIAIVAADGTVRAEQVQLVGPAQLPRRTARDAYLSTHLNVVAGPDDHLAVQWLKGAQL
jgi:hypothetical protein